MQLQHSAMLHLQSQPLGKRLHPSRVADGRAVAPPSAAPKWNQSPLKMHLLVFTVQGSEYCIPSAVNLQ